MAGMELPGLVYAARFDEHPCQVGGDERMGYQCQRRFVVLLC